MGNIRTYQAKPILSFSNGLKQCLIYLSFIDFLKFHCVYIYSIPVMVLDDRVVFFRFQGFDNFQNFFVITFFGCFKYPFPKLRAHGQCKSSQVAS